MKTERKIVNLFIEHTEPKTIREISKQINADYRITYTAVQRLIKKDILRTQTIGKSSVCQLNDAYYGLEIYEAESKRKEEIFKKKNIKQLYKELNSKLDTNLFILLLFGSYAKSKQTKSSDIDLLFISNEKGLENKVSDILSILPLKNHVLVFTEEEFKRMKDSKKSNVVKEAMECNFILYGIEAYYRLKNA